MYRINDRLDQHLEDWDETEVEGLMSQLDYTGFNPVEQRARLLAKIEEGEFDLKDIGTALSIYLKRGSKISNMTNKMSAEGKLQVKAIQTRLSLKDTGRVIGESQITLPRLASCFPDYLAKLMKKFPNHVKFTHFARNLPDCLRFPAAASMIPVEEDDLSELHQEWMAAFGELINSKSKARNVHQDEEYYNIARNSAMFTSDERYELMVSLGVLTQSFPTGTKRKQLDDHSGSGGSGKRPATADGARGFGGPTFRNNQQGIAHYHIKYIYTAY